MKKLLLLFFITLSISGSGQTSVYHPFPDSNAIWSTLSVYDSDQNYSRFGIIGDTNINAILYHKIYSLHDSVLTKSGAVYFGALRENSRKVYFQYYNCQQETLLYDFTKEVGDTIYSLANEHTIDYCFPTTSFWSVLTNIDSMIIDGSYRRVYHLSLGDAFWIEGIGSNYGLFNPIEPQVAGNYSWSLICFKQNDETLYVNPLFLSCYPDYNGIKNTIESIGKNVKVFPNPSNGSFTVDLDNLINVKEIRILNLLGKIVFQQSINNQSKINIDNLPSGVYILTVIDNENKMTNIKIISSP